MDKEELKIISFCMPVFGDAESVGTAVDSIMDQDYPALEVILSVDGCKESEKAVKKIVEKYKKDTRRVEAIYSKQNRGACIARNEAAKIAKGDYLSFLPADAKLLPGMARVWMDYLKKYPDYDFLYGGYRFLDQKLSEEEAREVAEHAHLSFEDYMQQSGMTKNFDGTYKGVQGFDYMSSPFDPYFLEVANYIDGSFPLKKEIFWKAGGWDPKIKSLQDWDLWLSVVKKAGGKGLFVRDIYFETTYPHKGGLSDDSTKHWIERTNTIKKKHGIPDRKICVASLGAPFHGRRMAYVLNADFKEMPSFKPNNYEAVYQLGFFPSMADICFSVFDRCRGKKIIHWIGSDIWQMQQADFHTRKTLLSYFENAIDEHLCEFEHTQKELKELGIKAKVVPLPPKEWFDSTPLPETFTVAVYQPATNSGFYLPEICREVSKLCPEIKFKFFGDNTHLGTINNVQWTGYIEDMEKFVSECSALMRLTIHDGLPISVLEFLGAGRQVLCSVPVKYAEHETTANPQAIAIKLKAMAKKKADPKAAKYWRNKASHKKYKEAIYDLAQYKPEEYWENRADSWDFQASRGYSLPREDFKIIQDVLKDIQYKSVLDLGCGNGRFVPLFEGKKYAGCDISNKLINICKGRYGDKRFFKKKVEDLKYRDGHFDLLFSYTTFEHIKAEDWPKAIKAMKDVGRKYLLLVEPEDFESVGYCHNHLYKKDFHVLKKKKLSDKTLYLCDLRK